VSCAVIFQPSRRRSHLVLTLCPASHSERRFTAVDPPLESIGKFVRQASRSSSTNQRARWKRSAPLQWGDADVDVRDGHCSADLALFVSRIWRTCVLRHTCPQSCRLPTNYNFNSHQNYVLQNALPFLPRRLTLCPRSSCIGMTKLQNWSGNTLLGLRHEKVLALGRETEHFCHYIGVGTCAIRVLGLWRDPRTKLQVYRRRVELRDRCHYRGGHDSMCKAPCCVCGFASWSIGMYSLRAHYIWCLASSELQSLAAPVRALGSKRHFIRGAVTLRG